MKTVLEFLSSSWPWAIAGAASLDLLMLRKLPAEHFIPIACLFCFLGELTATYFEHAYRDEPSDAYRNRIYSAMMRVGIGVINPGLLFALGVPSLWAPEYRHLYKYIGVVFFGPLLGIAILGFSVLVCAAIKQTWLRSA